MAWNTKSEMDKLTKHIKKSVDAEKPGNALWRHFGLSHAAHLSAPKSGEDARLDYLMDKMDQLSKQLEPVQNRREAGTGHKSVRLCEGIVDDDLVRLAQEFTGVGEKTAVELIKQFGSLAALYERLDEVPRATLREKLAVNRENAMLSFELITVREDLELPWSWDDLRRAPIRRDALLALARRYEIARLERVAMDEGVDDVEAGTVVPSRPASRRGTAAETPAPGVMLMGTPSVPPEAAASAAPMPGESSAIAPLAPAPPSVPAPARASSAGSEQGALDLWGDGVSVPSGAPAPLAFALDAPADLNAIIARLHAVRARSVHGFALLPVSEPGDARTTPLIGLGIAARDGTACYLPLGHARGPNLELERVREWLGLALADASVPKVGHDLKRDAHILAAAGLPLAGLAFDVHVASFLCDPARDHGLTALARDVLAVALPPLEPEMRKGRGRAALSELGVAEAAGAAVAQVGALYPIAEALLVQLERREKV
jgi:DNA polymerase-1